MKPHVKELFSYKKIYDQLGSEEIFIEAMKESVLHHQGKCSFYNDLLVNKDFKISSIKTIGDISKIPMIPANFLKYNVIKSVDDNEVEVHATSSGTMGQKSQVFLDKETIKLATKMAIKMMRYHKFFSIIPTNYFIMGYEPKKTGANLGNVQLAQAMTRFAPAKEKIYALRSIGDRYEIDYFGIIKGLKKFNRQKLPVRIMGFPSYLYMIVETMKEAGIKPLKLNKKSIVLTGGGWKKFDDIMIDKDEYYQMIEDYLGIPKENCRDFYSAVEHSVAYPECKNHHMHVPIWSRVIVRDSLNLEPLGFDQPGFLNFISPLVQSQPISSILMGDIGVLKDGTDCGCGITTPYFEVLGRAGTAKVKTCAVTASELLKGANNG